MVRCLTNLFDRCASGESIDAIIEYGQFLFTLSGGGKRACSWFSRDGALSWEASVFPAPVEGAKAEEHGTVVGATIARGGACWAVLAQNRVQCLSTSRGSVEWEWSLDADVIAAGGRAVAVRSSEDGEALFVATSAIEGSDHVVSLYKLDPKTGKSKGDQQMRVRAPVSADGKLPEVLVFTSGSEGVAALALDDGGSTVQVLGGMSGQTTSETLEDLTGDISGGEVIAGQTASELVALTPRASANSWKLPTAVRLSLSTGHQILVGVRDVDDDSVVLEGSAVLAPHDHRACGAARVGGDARTLCAETSSSGTTVTLHPSGAGDRTSSGDAEVHEVPSLTLESCGGAIAVYPIGFKRRGGDASARALVVTADENVHLVQQGTVGWTRHEGLSRAVQAIGVVPPGDIGTGESTTGTEGDDDHDAVDLSFEARMKAQIAAAEGFIKKLTNLVSGGASSVIVDPDDAEAVAAAAAAAAARTSASNRAHGFDRIFVVRTAAGGLAGISGETGDVLWSRYSRLAATGESKLAVSRERQVVAFGPEVLHVGPDVDVPGSTVAEWIDPITGRVVQTTRLSGVSPKFVVPVSVHDATHRHAVLVVGGDEEGAPAALVPSTPSAVAAFEAQLGKFVAHMSTERSVIGVGLARDAGHAESARYITQLRWEYAAPAGASVVQTATSSMQHSPVSLPARILGDDSLLTKYLNPHLLLVATERPRGALPTEAGEQPSGPEVDVALLDGVTGRVVHRGNHPHARGPVHAAIIEHSVYYTYENTKTERNEIRSLALYEPHKIARYQLNPFSPHNTSAAFTSYELEQPVALHRTFVLPGHVDSMAPTRTAHSISTPGLLLGLRSGSIMMLDTRWVDPRRPLEKPTAAEKAEGLPQYQPFLPMSPQKVLSYSQPVERPRVILSLPATLESTTVIFAAGLDTFYTRTTPSQPFDILATDFNKLMLVTMGSALAIATFLAGQAARNKQLKQSWE